MSRGPGLLMRRVIAELKKAHSHCLTRRQLEDRLCPEGYRSDNVLRAVRTLARMYKVSYVERRFPEDSTVHLPIPVENPIPEEEIYALLERSG